MNISNLIQISPVTVYKYFWKLSYQTAYLMKTTVFYWYNFSYVKKYIEDAATIYLNKFMDVHELGKLSIYT